MKPVNSILFSSIALAILGVAGCDVFVSGRHREERVYVQQQPPQYVEPQVQYVIVEQAPPPIVVERRPAAPSVNHVWIEGSWAWENQRYNWQAGRYAVPPAADVVWVSASYQRDSHGYRYSPGQWKKQNQPKRDGDHDNRR